MVVRLLLVLFIVVLPGTARADASRVHYSRDIRPILSRNCFACHGPDQGSREAGLRLDQREAALIELDSGERAIVPGEVEQSELLARVTVDDPSLRMPPAESGKSLKSAEIELLRRWVEQGAEYEDHWSFRPLQKPVPPDVPHSEPVRNDVDRFVLAKLQESGLTPSPEADRQVLIRRLHFDLLGLPPTAEEVNAFLVDKRPDAYEQLVERLLASPHFGERWGRHWLDLARYADSNGYLGDELRPDAFRYRDWVVKSINDDLPFDQFTIMQLAGDLLKEIPADQQVATGFHRNSMKNTEAGVDKEADRVIQTVDRLSSVGTAWLGLTIGCAECHTHKFDPISHHEFYQLYAFFNNLDETELKLGDAEVAEEVPAVRSRREKQIKKITAQLAQKAAEAGGAAEASLEKYLTTLGQPEMSRSEPDRESLEHWRADLDADGRRLAKEYEKLALQRPSAAVPVAPIIREREKRRTTHIHLRGDFRQPGEEVQPGTPRFLPPLQPRGETADRLDLARWLVRNDQPLTPRTAVNHFWKHLFGQGLVETEDNFGTTGSEPSHPELLDWLASQFVESGWSRKEIIRQIVNSATYRQSSHLTDELRERDPQNRWLARQSRLRLEGEIIRDVALSSSGLLNPRIGGPSIRPPLNSRITTISRNQEWNVSPGAEKYRRGLYILFRRATPYPMLTTFDVPDSTTSCADRERSNTPLQALTLLNDPVFFECAQSLGKQLAELDRSAPQNWIEVAVQRTLSRQPTPEEVARLMELHQLQLSNLQSVPKQDVVKIAGQHSKRVDPYEQAARVLVARSLMNLDEFITRE